MKPGDNGEAAVEGGGKGSTDMAEATARADGTPTAFSSVSDPKEEPGRRSGTGW